MQVPPQCILPSQYESDSPSPDLNSSLSDINDNSIDECEEEDTSKFPPHSFDKRVYIQKTGAKKGENVVDIYT